MARRGFSMLEVMAALFIVTSAIFALVAMQIYSLQVRQASGERHPDRFRRAQ